MGHLGPVASIHAILANRRMGGHTDECQMLGYVMSFADRLVSKVKNGSLNGQSNLFESVQPLCLVFFENNVAKLSQT